MDRRTLMSTDASESGKRPENEAALNGYFLVNAERLGSVSDELTLVGHLRSLWSFRYFILADARFRAFRTNQDYRLWKAWLVVYPLLEAALYGVMFGLVLRASRGIDNYVGYLLLGICIFNMISRMTSSGLGLVRGSLQVIRSFQFPAAAVVLSNSLRQFLDSLLSIGVAVVAALVFQGGNHFSFRLLGIVPVVILTAVFGTGCMFLAARMTAFVPDIKVVAELFIRAWLFMSAVFYPIERFEGFGAIYTAVRNNPAFVYMDSVRRIVLEGQLPSLMGWVMMVIWALGMLVVGALVFEQSEGRYRTLA